MATYKIGQTREGARVWWAHWQSPYGMPGTVVVRDATNEEAALMEKVVWERDHPTDLEKIKTLIQQP